jgi:hypothetical protein
MPIALLLLKRWAESAKKTIGAAPTQTALTAASSSVNNSPVVRGWGNIQNLNAPVFNVNIGQPAAVPAQAEPARPKLKIEIKQVCFSEEAELEGSDLSDFRVDRYIFVHIWAVNTESVTTSVKQMSLSYSTAGETVAATPVRDLSKWFQRVKSQERGLDFETRVVKQAHKTLTPFSVEPLQQGILLKGWVCFKARGVVGLSDEGRIDLCVEDSFGKEHHTESSAPFGCEGVMVDHLDGWRNL